MSTPKILPLTRVYGMLYTVYRYGETTEIWRRNQTSSISATAILGRGYQHTCKENRYH